MKIYEAVCYEDILYEAVCEKKKGLQANPSPNHSMFLLVDLAKMKSYTPLFSLRFKENQLNINRKKRKNHPFLEGKNLPKSFLPPPLIPKKTIRLPRLPRVDPGSLPRDRDKGTCVGPGREPDGSSRKG